MSIHCLQEKTQQSSQKAFLILQQGLPSLLDSPERKWKRIDKNFKRSQMTSTRRKWKNLSSWQSKKSINFMKQDWPFLTFSNLYWRSFPEKTAKQSSSLSTLIFQNFYRTPYPFKTSGTEFTFCAILWPVSSTKESKITLKSMNQSSANSLFLLIYKWGIVQSLDWASSWAWFPPKRQTKTWSTSGSISCGIHCH